MSTYQSQPLTKEFLSDNERNVFDFEYSDSQFDSFLYDIAEKMCVPCCNNTVQLPSNFGDGVLKNILIDDGFVIRLMDFKLLQDFHFIRLYPTGDEKIFQLYLLLDKTDIHFFSDSSTKKDQLKNSIFMCNKLLFQGKFPKEEQTKIVVAMFTESWAFSNGLLSTGIMESLLYKRKEKPLCFFRKAGLDEYNLANSLINFHDSSLGNKLSFKINSMLFINHVISSFTLTNEKETGASTSSHISKVAMAERRLIESLRSSPPSISQLSAEVNLSSSTLARHFKLVFGKNIYQYYLEKKMELAREMLQDENLPVSTVAYSLGYEKVNSLTIAFRKVYQILPRSLKPKKEHSQTTIRKRTKKR